MGLRRSAKYGSPHVDEHSLQVKAVTLSDDGRTVTLKVPELAPADGMKIEYALKAKDSRPVKGLIHATIHNLARDWSYAPRAGGTA